MSDLDLPALARSSLADSTAEILRERIIQGVFAPGTRLVEVDIARRLGTSRAPVREALAMLRAEGLAYEEPGRGSFVAKLSRDEVEEVYELRAALESAAARLVIDRGDPADVAALDRVLATMRRTVAAKDRRAFIDADLALHGELCKRSGNRRLYRTWETQIGLLRVLIGLETTDLMLAASTLIDEHAHLVDEVRKGDAGRATEAAWSLFRSSSLLITGTEADSVPPSGGQADARSTRGGPTETSRQDDRAEPTEAPGGSSLHD